LRVLTVNWWRWWGLSRSSSQGRCLAWMFLFCGVSHIRVLPWPRWWLTLTRNECRYRADAWSLLACSP
jgi:hypothetical protein